MVGGALRHRDPLADRDRVAIRARATADASLRVSAHLGLDRIGVEAERSMVGLASYIAHRKHDVFSELALHREAPLLDGGRHQVRIDAAGAVDRARLRYPRAASRRQRLRLVERKQSQHPPADVQLLAGVIGWIGVGPVA